MSVNNIRKFSAKLGQTMNFIVGETIEILKGADIKKFALDKNKDQLDAGLDSKGKSLGEYTDYSKYLKAQKGQFSGHIILEDTNAFRESRYVKADQLSPITPALAFGATDPKWKNDIEPQERFSDALGTNDETNVIIGGMIATKLSKRLSKFWKI